MKKTPVSNDKYVRFHAAFVLITNEFGILDDPDVARACDILLEKLAQRVGKTKAKQGQRGAWKFYNFFRQKYLQFTDFEYEGTFGAKEIKMTNIMLEKLNKHDVTMEEYVTWLFDELFPNNEKLSPGLGLALSSNILQDYLYRNRDKLSKKKAVLSELMQEQVVEPTWMGNPAIAALVTPGWREP